MLTKTDQDFSFTYSDNGFAKLIAKMALDGFCPSYEEFKEAMLNGKMPVSEFLGGEESARSFYKVLKLDFSSYKLAHIVDSGKHFWINGRELGLAEICNTYFPAGDISRGLFRSTLNR